jgi:hypothetical protein
MLKATYLFKVRLRSTMYRSMNFGRRALSRAGAGRRALASCRHHSVLRVPLLSMPVQRTGWVFEKIVSNLSRDNSFDSSASRCETTPT